MNTRERIAFAVERVRKGRALVDVAEDLAMSRDVLKKACRAEGVIVSAQHDTQFSTAEQRARAVQLVRQGKTFGEAAEALGLTRNIVAGAVSRAKAKRQLA